MSKNRSRASALAVAAWLCAWPASGGGEPGGEAIPPEPVDLACAEQAAAAVQSRYDGAPHLNARFTQRTESVALGGGTLAAEDAQGEVWFAKPGKMRWTYATPAPSVVVTDGTTLWIFDPMAGEVQRLPVDEGYLSGTAVQFLLGEGSLEEAFEVTALSCGTASVRLGLAPREAATYERLELEVATDGGDLRETVIVDLFGNRTEVRFEAVRTDLAPPGGTFVFEVPDGVRVLELAPVAPPQTGVPAPEFRQ